MKIEITVPNVWTSLGKHLRGEVVDVPDDEGKALVSAKQAKPAAAKKETT